jgi:hypothetical protein
MTIPDWLMAVLDSGGKIDFSAEHPTPSSADSAAFLTSPPLSNCVRPSIVSQCHMTYPCSQLLRDPYNSGKNYRQPIFLSILLQGNVVAQAVSSQCQEAQRTCPAIYTDRSCSSDEIGAEM